MMPMAIICTARVRAPVSAPRRSPRARPETLPGTSSARRCAGESRSGQLVYHVSKMAYAAYPPARMPTTKEDPLPRTLLSNSSGRSFREAPNTRACERSATTSTQQAGGGDTLVKKSARGFEPFLALLQATATPFNKRQRVWAMTRSAPMSLKSTSRRPRSSKRRCCEAALTRWRPKPRARSLHKGLMAASAPKNPASGPTTLSSVPSTRGSRSPAS
mmetsp:Transcript_36205/g.112718  ORF Transcript_36205/g.112718 Transcript_36205/m.112718 type:complete len:217 (+) Transcript_36205:78-728(+)